MSIFLAKPKESERKRLAKLIASGELIPVMNDTKWGELIVEMRAGSEFKPQFRVKDLFGVDGYVSPWDGDFFYHIHPVASIEWLELRSRSPDWLCSALRKHSVPFSLEDGHPRVWGYTRPGKQPEWH